MASLTELLAQKAALEKQIAQTQREERQKAIAQVKALMAEYGLTAADLSARPAKPRHTPAPRWPPNTATRPPAKPGAAAACSRAGSRRRWLRARSWRDFAV